MLLHHLLSGDLPRSRALAVVLVLILIALAATAVWLVLKQ